MNTDTALNSFADLPNQSQERLPEEEGITLSDVTSAFVANWRKLISVPLAAGVATFGVASLITPTFTARTVFLPPQQQQQSIASTALANLGPLASLAGGAGVLRTPSDQYIALMQSVNVQDRIVDKFHLQELYKEKFRVDARRDLTNNVHISSGKKDGLITVEVDDNDPQRAAQIANAHVEELRRLSNELVLTEAQQRRAFFDSQLRIAKDNLATAQLALQNSGFSQGSLRTEPKAAAEEYARLKAGVTTAEVKLQMLRGTLAGNTPEILQQQAALGALRTQLTQVEQKKSADTRGDSDSSYVSKYREFKYRETLYDLVARQYELARLDESREGALLQVVDVATAPERKSKPKRGLMSLTGALLAGFALSAWVIFNQYRTKRRQ